MTARRRVLRRSVVIVLFAALLGPASAAAHDPAEDEVAALTERIAKNPDDLGARRLRGRLFIQLRAFEAAIRDFDKVVAEEPLDDMGYVYRGIARFGAGRVPEALDDIESAIALGTGWPDAFFYQAEIHRARGETEEAIAAYGASIGIKPYPVALCRRAELKAEAGDVEAAAADLEQARSIAPEDVEVQIQQAELRFAQGERKEAANELFALAKALPRDPRARLALGRLRTETGEVLEAEGHLARAVALFGAVAAHEGLAPDAQAHLLARRAEAQALRRRHDEALADLDRALELAPRAFEIHRQRAKLLVALDRLGEAAAARARANAIVTGEGEGEGEGE